MNKEIEGLQRLAEYYVPMDVVKVYNHFIDKYRMKHLTSLLETYTTGNHQEWLDRRGEVFNRYISIFHSTEAVIKRELKEW